MPPSNPHTPSTPPQSKNATQPTNPHPAHALLLRAHSPTTATQIHTSKVLQKPLLLRPTSPPPSNARARRRHARLAKKSYFLKHQRPRPLSAKQKRALGFSGRGFVDGLRGQKVDWAVWEQLHAMWGGYMREVLGVGVLDTAPAPASTDNKDRKEGGGELVTAQHHGARIASADFHGAMVEVVRSRCVGRVGIRGVVVRDGKFAFVVVEKGGGVKTVPKEHTIFRVEIPMPARAKDEKEGEAHDKQEKENEEAAKPLVFELHGSQFENRAPDRANKKFKWKGMDYL